jgi:hypothetical protein
VAASGRRRIGSQQEWVALTDVALGDAHVVIPDIAYSVRVVG